jgi:hypothetical protein
VVGALRWRPPCRRRRGGSLPQLADPGCTSGRSPKRSARRPGRRAGPRRRDRKPSAQRPVRSPPSSASMVGSARNPHARG